MKYSIVTVGRFSIHLHIIIIYCVVIVHKSSRRYRDMKFLFVYNAKNIIVLLSKI